MHFINLLVLILLQNLYSNAVYHNCSETVGISIKLSGDRVYLKNDPFLQLFVPCTHIVGIEKKIVPIQKPLTFWKVQQNYDFHLPHL